MDSKIEVWKQNNNFPKYEISSFGNVRNKSSLKLLKSYNKSGYYSLSLYNDENKRKFMFNHRLVALTFLENPENKKTVNHIDHNTTNNKLDNLEWATLIEQSNHKITNTKKRKEITMQNIWRVDKNTNEKIEKYINIKLAAKYLFDNNFTNFTEFNNGKNIISNINNACSGKQHSAYGYKWIYDEDNTKNFDGEIWKDIPPEFINGSMDYKVSNYGRIKNKTGRISEGFIHGGYLRVTILSKGYSLHRLVAKVFIPNPENKKTVNHKDGNKLNAKLDNLEWMTNRENSQHACDTGLNPNIKKITQYDLNINKIKEFNSQYDASILLNIARNSIGRCCRNTQKTAGGFMFKFSEKNERLKIHEYAPSISPNIKKVIQYDLLMNKINEFNNQKEASKALNIAHTSINRCCINKQHKAGKFIFKFAENNEELPYVYYNGKTSLTIKKITQYDLNMNKIREFNTQIDVVRALNISRKYVSKCCMNTQKIYKNFIFRYSENTETAKEDTPARIILPRKKSVVQYDLEMNKLGEFESQTAAANSLNLSRKSVGKCCNGKQKNVGDFIFRFLENT